MPVLDASDYRPPFLFRHGHVNTIYPNLFRRFPPVQIERETISTPDDDFMDIDWIKGGNDRLIILVHGLEGSSDSVYIKGMVQKFTTNKWDALAMNFRSCSGRMNNQLRSYHMGASDDLSIVVQHAIEQGYQKIALAGFSLGGNVTLKYLGECGENIAPEIIAGVAVSVPCHIPSANVVIAEPQNRLYMWRFMRTLNKKAAIKAKTFADAPPMPAKKSKTFAEFDGAFTAPIHGFNSAEHYWDVNSSSHFIPHITIPTLLINAKDDSFLSPLCFPFEFAEQSEIFHLLRPDFGGHCGFYPSKGEKDFWAEKQAFRFLNEWLAE